MDGTKKYRLERLFYASWIYIGLMLLFAGGLSKFGHLIPLAFSLRMLQNYLVENKSHCQALVSFYSLTNGGGFTLKAN